MEGTKYFIIKINDFYLRDFYLNEENIETFFIRGLEFTSIKINAHQFNTIDDAYRMKDLLVGLGFVSVDIDSIII